MEQTQDIITEDTVKRLLTCMEKEPVDVCAGYLGQKNCISVFFTVYGEKETPMFEVSLGTGGKILYKDNKKFLNPPLFDEVFNKAHQMHQQKVAKTSKTNPKSTEAQIDHYQTLILDFLTERGIIQR